MLLKPRSYSSLETGLYGSCFFSTFYLCLNYPSTVGAWPHTYYVSFLGLCHCSSPLTVTITCYRVMCLYDVIRLLES